MFLFVLACARLGDEGASNHLDGSAVESYGLGFDETRALLYSSQLVIEYVAAPDTVVLRVMLDTDVEPSAGESYDLVQHGDVTPPGELERGQIELDEYGDDDGAKVAGSFDAAFVTGDELQGGFDANLEVVGL